MVANMNATTQQLSRLQEQIAVGDAPPIDKADEFYWHPHIHGFGLRLYANGKGTWLVQYRNHRGLQRRYKIGPASAIDLKTATKLATIAIGKIAGGEDPQGVREAERDKQKFTVAQLGLRMIADKAEEKKSPGTLKGYRLVLRNYLGPLGRMQADEVEPRQITEQIKTLYKHSKHNAGHTRSFLSALYHWARQSGLVTVPNPVTDTWRPPLNKSAARALNFGELGAIWRAAETMAKSAAEFQPQSANSVLDDKTLLTRTQAARQSGVHRKIISNAIYRGDLKVEGTRRDFGDNRGHRTTHVIKVGELNRFVAATCVRSVWTDYAAIIRLLMLLGGRYTEIAALKWKEIDLDKGLLHIEGERTEEHRGTKNKHDLWLPLSPTAISILREIKPRPGNEFVFGAGNRGLLDSGKTKQKLNEIIAAAEGKPLAPWRHHDLRHSISTNLNEMGVDDRVVEAIINHRSGHKKGIAGKYNHAKYLAAVKLALENWERAILSAASGEEVDTASNVINFFGKSA
jgi:integrase